MKYHRSPGNAKLSSLWKLRLHTMSIMAELVCTSYHTFQLRLQLNQLKESGQRRSPIWQTPSRHIGRALCLPDNEQEAPPGPTVLPGRVGKQFCGSHRTNQANNWRKLNFLYGHMNMNMQMPGISIPIGHRSTARAKQITICNNLMKFNLILVWGWLHSVFLILLIVKFAPLHLQVGALGGRSVK